jgi:hypothetical protein
MFLLGAPSQLMLEQHDPLHVRHFTSTRAKIASGIAPWRILVAVAAPVASRARNAYLRLSGYGF